MASSVIYGMGIISSTAPTKNLDQIDHIWEFVGVVQQSLDDVCQSLGLGRIPYLTSYFVLGQSIHL